MGKRSFKAFLIQLKSLLDSINKLKVSRMLRKRQELKWYGVITKCTFQSHHSLTCIKSISLPHSLSSSFSAPCFGSSTSTGITLYSILACFSSSKEQWSFKDNRTWRDSDKWGRSQSQFGATEEISGSQSWLINYTQEILFCLWDIKIRRSKMFHVISFCCRDQLSWTRLSWLVRVNLWLKNLSLKKTRSMKFSRLKAFINSIY